MSHGRLHSRLACALALLALAACSGPSLYANPTHRVPARPVVAVVPLMTPDGALVDTGLSAAFNASLRHALLPMTQLRERLRLDEPLRRRLARVARTPFRPDPGARPASLREILGDGDLGQLRDTLRADVLVFPVAWSMRSRLGHTAAVMTYRVYDLADGTLLLQNTERLDVDEGGTEGALLAAAAFSAATYRDYAAHVMSASAPGEL